MQTSSKAGWLALLLALIGLAGGARAGDSAPAGIFDRREIHSTNNAQFTQWRDLLARWERERRQFMPQEWEHLRDEVKALPDRDKLVRINDAFNRRPYVPSEANWGTANHWETPREFLQRSGQCQDYAIAKFLMLRAAGFPDARLRVVVVRDEKIDEDHAVLVAYIGNEAWLLDNLIARVVPVSEIHHYRPYYAINETGWWLYLPWEEEKTKS
ncbi:MAG TPA: transglutaminase-like cysteine peptidase [Stellaceae bacterium]|nr:transglutaminase-like cysteine peptidase [Stellaceae bacterium]